MKQINKIAIFAKASFKFTFGLIMVVIHFFFSETYDKQKVHEPLIKNQTQVSWAGLDETTDEGVKVVSKDGFIDY